MAAKKTKKKILKKTVRKRRKISSTVQEKIRYIPKPKNYAELMRKTRAYHKYTFKLPRTQPTKKDLQTIRNSKTIRNMWESGQYSADQIQKIIRRKAIDKNIDRKLSPQQKTAITKQWYGTKHSTGLKNVIQHLENKEAIFIPIVNIRAKPQYNRAKKTNKGIFMFKKDVKAKVINSGKNEYISFEHLPSEDKLEEFGRQIRTTDEIYYPFPRGVIIEDYINELYERFGARYDSKGNIVVRANYPNSMKIGLMGTIANEGHASIHTLLYSDSSGDGHGVSDLINDAKREGKTHPFSGVYFIWF